LEDDPASYWVSVTFFRGELFFTSQLHAENTFSQSMTWSKISGTTIVGNPHFASPSSQNKALDRFFQKDSWFVLTDP